MQRLTGLPDPLTVVATRAALDRAMAGWEADRVRFEAVIARYRLYE